MHAYTENDEAGLKRGEEIQAALALNFVPDDVEILLLSEDAETRGLEIAEWLNNKDIKGPIVLEMTEIAFAEDEEAD